MSSWSIDAREPVRDFDMHTTLVLAETVFPHQRAWRLSLGGEQVEALAKQPAHDLQAVFDRFQPNVRFALPAEVREALLDRMKVAGCSVTDLEELRQGWEVIGTISKLEHFSPTMLSQGLPGFDRNVLEVLWQAEKAYGEARDMIGTIDFSVDREWLASDPELAERFMVLGLDGSCGDHGHCDRLGLRQAVLRDLRAQISQAPGAGDCRAAMLARQAAVQQAWGEVARQMLACTRTVEAAYRQLDSLFANADDKASVIVVPTTPEDLSDEIWREYEHDYLRGHVPPKVAALRSILEYRNRILAPAGWVGLIVVPDVKTRGYQALFRALSAFSEEHRTVLLLTPRCDAHEGDIIRNLLEHQRRDPQAARLSDGTNPRVVHYIGDLLAREGFTDRHGEPLDEPIVIAPVCAVAGAFARNDARWGVHRPPASVRPGDGGEIDTVRVMVEFTDMQWMEAHNAIPQPMNVIFYHPRYRQAFVFGRHTARRDLHIGEQRVLDKLAVLLLKNFIEVRVIPSFCSGHRRADLKKLLHQVLRAQERTGAVQEGSRIDVMRTEAERWRASLMVRFEGREVQSVVELEPGLD